MEGLLFVRVVAGRRYRFAVTVVLAGTQCKARALYRPNPRSALAYANAPATSPRFTIATMSTRRLYFLDAYNAGDPSFLGVLGRYLAGRSEGAIILLDPTDRLLLSLEAAGAGDGRPISEKDVFGLANEPQQLELALRVVTEFTRSVAATLTELQVPAVSLQGSDRSLLRRAEPDGPLDASRGGWLCDLVSKGVVPVVSPLSKRPGADVIHLEKPFNVLEALTLGCANEAIEVVLFSDHRRPSETASEAVAVLLERLGHGSNVLQMDPASLRRVDSRETAGM